MSRARKILSATLIAAACLPGLSAAADQSAAQPAPAAEAKTPGSGPNPYRDCGIGAAIFDETGWAAVTSNVIWDLGTTALTSATSSPQTCNGKQVKAARFINDTYPKLVEETAAGQGEHLTTALNIMECDGAHHAAATQKVREAMQRVVSDPAYAGQSTLDKSAQMYFIVNQAVGTTCTS